MNELIFDVIGLLFGLAGAPNPEVAALAASWELAGSASDGLIIGNGRELDGVVARTGELAPESATTGIALSGVRVVRGRLVH